MLFFDIRPHLDEDEGVQLGDGPDAVLHLVLSHLHPFCLSSRSSVSHGESFNSRGCSLKTSHLNKLAVFLLLEQRVEPVHCHPVVLLDLRQADPAHRHEGGVSDHGDGDDVLPSFLSRMTVDGLLSLLPCKKNLGDDRAKPDRRQMSGRTENDPDSKLTFCSLGQGKKKNALLGEIHKKRKEKRKIGSWAEVTILWNVKLPKADKSLNSRGECWCWFDANLSQGLLISISLIWWFLMQTFHKASWPASCWASRAVQQRHLPLQVPSNVDWIFLIEHYPI